MKTTKTRTVICSTILGTILMAGFFVSCDDKDKKPEPPKVTMKANPAEVTVNVDATAQVTITGGVEPLKVVSDDEKIATATIKKSEDATRAFTSVNAKELTHVVTVKGVKEGTAKLKVTGAKNTTPLTIPVTVKPAAPKDK